MKLNYQKILKISLLILCMLIISGTSFLLGAQNKLKDKQESTITTRPLKINNQFFISDTPLRMIDDDLIIPVGPLLTYLSEIEITESDIIYVSDKIPYISLSNLQRNSNINIYNNSGKEDDIIYIDNYEEPFDYTWVNDNKLIAHALGEIDGNAYTNSLEAFLSSYEKGFRVFEVDLTLTSDGQLVALHDWSDNTLNKELGIHLPEEKKNQPLSQEEFLELKIKDQYTTLSFTDLVTLMNQYPDIYFITDTKETQEPYITQQFQCIRDTVLNSGMNPQVLDRIIPQIYGESMFDSIMNIYNWKSIVYTMYNQGLNFSPEKVIDFSYKNGIKVITTYSTRAHDLFLNGLLQRGMYVYMHTYNERNTSEMEFYKGQGVMGFYTDDLLP